MTKAVYASKTYRLMNFLNNYYQSGSAGEEEEEINCKLIAV